MTRTKRHPLEVNNVQRNVLVTDDGCKHRHALIQATAKHNLKQDRRDRHIFHTDKEYNNGLIDPLQQSVFGQGEVSCPSFLNENRWLNYSPGYENMKAYFSGYYSDGDKMYGGDLHGR